jgi:hypothetical protein
MAISTAYTALNVAVTVDGLSVIGLWDGDDAVTIEQGADVGTGLIGADGSGIFSQTADKSARVTIRVMDTSPTHAQLTRKWEQQRAGRLLAFPFDVLDKGSHEGGTADRCFIQQAPTVQKGKNASVRAWVLWTSEWKPAIPNG